MRNSLQFEGYTKTERKGGKNIFHANANQNKAGVAYILVSDKIYFQINPIIREKAIV